MVNRRDIHGAPSQADDGSIAPTTSHDRLTRKRIICHYEAKDFDGVLGLHTTVRTTLEKDVVACFSLWGGVDISQHGAGEFSDVNLAAAIAWRNVADRLGIPSAHDRLQWSRRISPSRVFRRAIDLHGGLRRLPMADSELEGTGA